MQIKAECDDLQIFQTHIFTAQTTYQMFKLRTTFKHT